MIPVPTDPFGPATTAAARAADPVVGRYRAFFAPLAWDRVPERDPRRPWPGRIPHPRSAYIRALLIKLCEGFRFVTELRRFLVEHPLLVLEVGFRPVRDPACPHGFDVERTVPGARWLRHQQQHLDVQGLDALFAGTVHAVLADVPDLGTTIAVDVKHICAWVRENNPKETIAHRCDPALQPRGDPDCRLGAKWRGNQDGGREKVFLWGYGTGIAVATGPVTGDVVLAEVTLPFNHQDIVWFHPVYDRTVAVLGRRPTNLAADAAFDAWYVYQVCAAHGGLAAIPRNERGAAPPRDAAGHPVCARGHSMVPTAEFAHEDGFRAQRYRCPLRWPVRTGATCDHDQFAKGPGCIKAVNIEAGGRMRAELDRQSAAYRDLYRQRTAAERINSQTTEVGIERPGVRRLAAVRRLTTLTYIVINTRALHRIRSRSRSRTTAAHPSPTTPP
jgi:hypothetical protein